MFETHINFSLFGPNLPRVLYLSASILLPLAGIFFSSQFLYSISQFCIVLFFIPSQLSYFFYTFFLIDIFLPLHVQHFPQHSLHLQTFHTSLLVFPLTPFGCSNTCPLLIPALPIFFTRPQTPYHFWSFPLQPSPSSPSSSVLLSFHLY